MPKELEAILRQNLLKETVAKEGVNFNDASGYDRAIADGNQEFLQTLKAQTLTNNIYHLVADMGLYRLRGDFKAAANCLQPIENNTPQNIINPQLIEIEEFQAGNYLLNGDIAEWRRRLQTVKTKYYPPIQQLPGLEKFSLKYIERVTLKADSRLIEPPSVTGIKGIQSLPLFYSSVAPQTAQKQTFFTPHLKVKVNNITQLFELDTGTYIGILPLHWVHNPHVQVIGTLNTSQDILGNRIETIFGIVDEIEIGNAVLKNIPFSFSNETEPSLGIYVLRQLGRVQISYDQLRFGEGLNYPCQQNIRLATAPDGSTAHLKIQIQLNNQPMMAIFDSGSGDYQNDDLLLQQPVLVIPKEGQLKKAVVNTTAGSHSMRIYQDINNLKIENIELGSVKVIHTQMSKNQAILMVNILKKTSLYLDFIEGKSCLIKRD
ncbi:retropepsin-like aspartic protease [Zymomonas mobilis]|nr:retropepsin-like aspartic protease [Zymomonas mobilis]MDX5949251.1 retropepsin-like aspartic protease [Zymomonas mobilis subsp. pomaceae]